MCGVGGTIAGALFPGLRVLVIGAGWKHTLFETFVRMRYEATQHCSPDLGCPDLGWDRGFRG